MIGESMQETASLYVLGLLEGDERTQFERELHNNNELQSLVRELSSAAALSAAALPESKLRAGLRDEILARVERAQELKLSPDQSKRRKELIGTISEFDLGKLTWVETPFEGVSAHVLPAARESQTVKTFLKIRQNCIYPSHTHHGGEDCVVLSGAFRDHCGVHKRGDYVFFGPNTEHLDLQALEGEDCVLFVVAHEGVDFHAA